MIPLLVLLAVAPPEDTPLAAERRGKAFWTALAKDCAVPPGETAAGLVSEAASLLGSPDSEWRDAIGYDVVVACAYKKRLLSAEERRALTSRLRANLRRGIGATGDDSVLLRSFSALDLTRSRCPKPIHRRPSSCRLPLDGSRSARRRGGWSTDHARKHSLMRANHGTSKY